jgi:hypothetical protein
MTGIAGDFLMPAFKFESCFIVIEVLDTFNDAEGLLSMALGAVLPEFVVVNIRVAGSAVIVPDPPELLEFLPVPGSSLMTSGTRHLLMLPGKLEFCLPVIEFSRGFESLQIVTIRAPGSKGLLVIIGMTCQARRAQSQVRELFLPDLLVPDPFSLMAILTFFLPVSPREPEAGEGVTEPVLVKPDDPEVQPVVVTVA